MAAGKAAGKDAPATWAALGHCGTYDYQRARNSAGKLVFYDDYTPVSNVNVGAFLNGEGWSKDMALLIARLAAHGISSNGANSTKALYTGLGYDLAATGGNPTCH